MAASPVRAHQWSQEACTIARQARSLNFLKIEPLIQKLQQTSGRSRRDCVLLIHRCTQERPMRRSWTEGEVEQVRELLAANPVEVVAKKIGRTPSSVKHLCSRVGIRSRELRCDLFSVTGLAAAIRVRKTEIAVWIEQGWLEALRDDKTRPTSYKISPEALQRCLREHLSDLQKRNIRSANILAVFQQYCYVPKHIAGEQLLQVREAKREQTAYDSATFIDR
jgi:hypothetical protein